MPWQVYNSAGQLLQATDLVDGTVTASKLDTNAVTNAKVADDAIGVAELSASGTASNSTFLRGDNAWAAAGATDISCRVHHSAAQTLTSGTPAILAFDSERFDTDNIHDNSTNNSRLTCKTAGKYFISLTMGWNHHSDGRRQSQIILNGNTSNSIAISIADPPPGDGPGINISTLWNMSVNDYVEVRAYQNCGSDLAVTDDGYQSAEFMMIKIA